MILMPVNLRKSIFQVTDSKKLKLWKNQGKNYFTLAERQFSFYEKN